MVLQVEYGHDKIRYPYKFNLVWLGEKDFGELVRIFLNTSSDDTLNPMRKLVSK